MSNAASEQGENSEFQLDSVVMQVLGVCVGGLKRAL